MKTTGAKTITMDQGAERESASRACITKVVLKNFRRFRETTIHFNSNLNMLVGDNEAGKSTILEAINLALTSRWQGRFFATEFSPNFINAAAATEYISRLRSGDSPEPPELFVEIFLADTPLTARLRGRNNSLGEDACGIRISASFDRDTYAEDYDEFTSHPEAIRSVPTEFYNIAWYDFARQPVNTRALKISASLIDASRIRLQSGADYYLQRIIADSLTTKQRVQLARSYRDVQESFAAAPAIGAINQQLNTAQAQITEKQFALAVDSSQSNQWESALAPHLDDLPLHFSGNGEQNKLKILLALTRRVEESNAILIEEPENHLSFSSLNELIGKIQDKCHDRQIIITTHSSFVVNKLGLDQLMLLGENGVTRLSELSVSTQDYFKKLSGYDTLRLVLAKVAILVEGPSDELIMQRAFRDLRGRRPIEAGVDVINVRGLTAKRFLDLSIQLGRKTVVVNDNDGDYSTNIIDRYAEYNDHPFVSICASDDNSLKTLEPQLAGANGLDRTNSILGTHFTTQEKLVKFMTSSDNKTDCALAFHDTQFEVCWPKYIKDAVNAAVK